MSSSHSTNPSGYEKRDANVRSLVGVILVSVVVIVIAVVLLYDYFIAVREEVVLENVLQPESPDLKALQAAEVEVLTSYRLIDSTRETYQVPIDSAMVLMAREASGTQIR
ncbi:MAG: hypothetical protein GY867_11840 [bacterium]|nr:hypothetical protein [bacterium]